MISAFNLAVDPVHTAPERGFSEPEEHVAVLLLRFADGECSAEERAEVCRMLRLHPVWLRWLAEKVRDRRNVEQQGQPDGNS
jgi:hypothetical protein